MGAGRWLPVSVAMLASRVRGAGRGHGGAPLALDDERAGVHGLAHAGMGGHALAGERRGVDGEGVHRFEAQIGRDPVSLAEQDDVTGDQLFCVDLDRRAVAHDGGPARQEITEPLGGVLGALFLHECKRGVEHDDDEDGHAQLGHPGDERQHARHPQQQGEEVDHLGGEAPPRRCPRRQWEQVGAVGREPAFRFRRGETTAGLVRGLDRGHPTRPTGRG